MTVARSPVARSSIWIMLGATLLWGASSAALAAVDGALTSSALVAAAGGVTLLMIAGVRGQRPLRVFTETPWLYVQLGALEAANLLLFVAALKCGPLPVVVPLHLTAPLLLLGFAVLRGRRPMTVPVGVEFVLVAVAIAVAAGGSADIGTGRAVLGCVLAVGSAVCVALLVSLIARESAQRPTIASAGWQLAVASALGAGLVASDPPTVSVVWAMVLIGALLLGPGFVLYWLGLRHLDATTASILGLNEAVFAAVVSALFTDTPISAGAVIAGALVLSALLLREGLSAR
ncbi:DMT family transporter [Nocardia asteroides]|uniref:DMT family transporter n=1 Tax=Nocardia asteroides TaxID=1824 RepID=UPI001E3B43EE|nr:DMT family transporter [Nocardia asteroides]UGT54434.1 DMT family transporter [Nocardia asteroides]